MFSNEGKLPLWILLIGSLPPPIGGTSVSFKNLVESLGRQSGVRISVIDTAGIRDGGVSSPLKFARLIYQIIKLSHRVDVVTLHVNMFALTIIGPFVVTLAKIIGKPVIIRRFNGRDHNSVKGFKFKLVDWSIRHSNLYLVQTKKNIEVARSIGIHKVEWFPTSRRCLVGSTQQNTKTVCNKFVFLSHVRPDKGIPEIIAVAKRLPPHILVHIYGPLLEGVDIESFSACQNIEYRGVVDPDDVVSILQQYDALLLPTYCEGEGYPGIILEAFGIGIPVISTRWGGIPEIVDESCGILVMPRDAEDLYCAVTRLCADRELYMKLCLGAAARQKSFDLDFWTERFVEFCTRVARNGVNSYPPNS